MFCLMLLLSLCLAHLASLHIVCFRIPGSWTFLGKCIRQYLQEMKHWQTWVLSVLCVLPFPDLEKCLCWFNSLCIAACCLFSPLGSISHSRKLLKKQSAFLGVLFAGLKLSWNQALGTGKNAGCQRTVHQHYDVFGTAEKRIKEHKYIPKEPQTHTSKPLQNTLWLPFLLFVTDLTPALGYSQFHLVEMGCITSVLICLWMMVKLACLISEWMEWFCAQLRKMNTATVGVITQQPHAVVLQSIE